MTQKKKSRKEFYKLEKVFKGVANHRRLEIVLLLAKKDNLSTDEIVEELNAPYQTVTQHLHKLVSTGLVDSYREGVIVRYTPSPYGKSIINLCINI
ncbi:MAG: winged helix-turn-helix domain-containing protein [Candidatus Paceibacterota bacterium]